MRKLDESKVYSLKDLTSEEYRTLYNWLLENDIYWRNVNFECWKNNNKENNLKYRKGQWNMYSVEPTHNAKELFYTLENVQVDCRELTKEQIKEMADVFEKNGVPTDFNSLYKTSDCYYLHKGDNLCFVRDKDRDKPYEITYDKFMELFNEKDKRNAWYTYKNVGKGNWLMYHDFNKNKIYGFCEYDGTWFENSYDLSLDEDSILAPKEEVEKRLIREAEKRGFKGTFEYDSVYNELWCDKESIFREGTWGEPLTDNIEPLIRSANMLKSLKPTIKFEEKPQFFQVAGRGKVENKNCYYFHHSEKYGPNFYIKEEVPYHDGEDWKEDLVVYTQLGSGKKFVTTKERFKKFKEVWV